MTTFRRYSRHYQVKMKQAESRHTQKLVRSRKNAWITNFQDTPSGDPENENNKINGTYKNKITQTVMRWTGLHLCVLADSSLVKQGSLVFLWKLQGVSKTFARLENHLPISSFVTFDPFLLFMFRLGSVASIEVW